MASPGQSAFRVYVGAALLLASAWLPIVTHAGWLGPGIELEDLASRRYGSLFGLAQSPDFDSPYLDGDLDEVVVPTYLANLGRSCLVGGGVFELAAVLLLAAGAVVGVWLGRLDQLWVFAACLGLWFLYDMWRLADCMDSVRVSYRTGSGETMVHAPGFGAALSPWGWIAAGWGLTMLARASLVRREPPTK